MKNILIFTNKADLCSRIVSHEIQMNGFNVIHVNVEDVFDLNFEMLNVGNLNKKDFQSIFNVKSIDGVWFRRSNYTLQNFMPKNCISSECLDSILFNYMERIKLLDFFFDQIRLMYRSNCLGNFNTNRNLNKLEVILNASKFGLLIPQSFLCNRFSSLSLHLKEGEDLITKAIHESPKIRIENGFKMGYTAHITHDNIDRCFDVSLIQQKIDIAFEIRAIFFNGTFFTIGQKAKYENGIHDIKFYSKKKRIFKYNLEYNIKLKLIELLNYYSLDFCCIDLLLSDDGRIYFLELNPGGTFSNISQMFSFQVEKKIAKYLCKN